MPNAGEVRIKNFREMSRAFAKADKELRKDLTSKLKDVAEPVRTEATARALREIPNIGGPWAEMRTGVTTSVVYVAPKQRRRGGSPRPYFGTLLMDRAMQPALDAHSNDIERDLGHMLDELARDWARGG